MAVVVPRYVFRTPVTWKSTTGVNRYGEAITTDRTIKVRYEPHRKRTFNKGGQKVNSIGIMYCKEKVEINDIISLNGINHPVLDVALLEDEWGREYMREVIV